MPADEPGDTETNPWFSLLLRTTSTLTIAVLLYVLSIGPAAKITWGTAALDMLRPIYAPLISAANHSTAVGHALQFYFRLWGVPV